MRSRARFFHHPLHPMLVMFPTALFPLLVGLDVLHVVFDDASFWNVGFWLAAAGVVTTLAAMAPGVVDMAAIPDGTKAHRTGVWHAVIGVLTLLAYAAATWVRWPAGSPADDFAFAAGIDAFGVLLVALQGWLGAELVYRHHVGVNAEREGGEPVVLLHKNAGTPPPTLAKSRGRRPEP